MKAKTFEAQYELTDFNLYIDDNNEKNETISVIDFVVESDNIDFVKSEFNNIFVVDTDKVSYLFSDYKISECYEVGENLIRVICIK